MADGTSTGNNAADVQRLLAEIERLKAEAIRLSVQSSPAASPAESVTDPPVGTATIAAAVSDLPKEQGAARRVPPPPPKTITASAATALLGSATLPAGAATKPALSDKPGAVQEKPAASTPAAEKPTSSDDLPEPSRWHFARRTFHSLGAFSTSLIVHVAGLIILGMWTFPEIIHNQLELITATESVNEEVTEVLQEDLDPTEEISFTDSSPQTNPQVTGLNGLTGAKGAVGTVGVPLDTEASESLDMPMVAVGSPFGDVGLGSGEGGEDVPMGTPGEPMEVVDSYAEAMDRITQEILLYLFKSDVLVLWLFDESESMKDDQEEIRTRIERVYKELGLTDRGKTDALMTTIASYGEKYHPLLSRPTSKLGEIRDAIKSVPVDETGLEITWPSMGQFIHENRRFAKVSRRQMVMILVTDESGEDADNVANLELAIQEAKSANCPIYILGREAVFGYPYAFMNWTHKPSGYNFWLQINRGPESAFPEQLQTNGLYRRHDAFPSGFGPYEQSRAARETGGIFFLLPSPEINLVGRDDRKYAAQMMRPYLPDLGPRDNYITQREDSELRSTVWKVIWDLNPYNPRVQPHIEMAHSFSLDPATFVRQVRNELEKAKRYFLYLHEAEKALESLKPRRKSELSYRWKANYDLIYSQIIAYKVRLYEYGAMLEDFIKNPKQLKNPFKDVKGFPVMSTHWEIAHRPKTLTDDTTKDYREQAAKMLKQVIEDHAGTPWSARAEWELARGFGFELVEDYDDPRRSGLGIKLPKL